jgi:hypothetical protein
LPRKGYKTVGKESLPDEIVEAIDKLKKDPDFIREMRLKGYSRISRRLVIHIAVLDLLRRKGIIQTSASEGK